MIIKPTKKEGIRRDSLSVYLRERLRAACRTSAINKPVRPLLGGQTGIVLLATTHYSPLPIHLIARQRHRDNQALTHSPFTTHYSPPHHDGA